MCYGPTFGIYYTLYIFFKEIPSQQYVIAYHLYYSGEDRMEQALS